MASGQKKSVAASPMLSLHAVRILGGVGNGGGRAKRQVKVSREARILEKGQRKGWRTMSTGVETEAKQEKRIKPTYDARREKKPIEWARSRKEELEAVMSKVHPDAVVRTASQDFVFRVRANETVSTSEASGPVGDIKGLLKPPAIMRGTDEKLQDRRRKISEQRDEILSPLHGSSEMLSPSQVNKVYEKLQAWENDEIKRENGPWGDLEAQKHSSSSSLASSSTNNQFFASNPIETRISSRLSGNKSILAVRDRFVREINANYEEQLEMAQKGLLAPHVKIQIAAESQSGVNSYQSRIYRSAGMAAQAVVVAPLALANYVMSQAAPIGPQRSSKGPLVSDFWAFEKEETRRILLESPEAQAQEVLDEIESLKKAQTSYEASRNPVVRAWEVLRYAPRRALWFFIKMFTWYPLIFAKRIISDLGLFLLMAVAGPLRIASATIATFETHPRLRNSFITRAVSTTWTALAPLTWQQYLAGLPLGSLLDRSSTHSHQLLDHSRSSFHALGYSFESMLSVLHSNRLVGLTALFFACSLFSASIIDVDPSLFSMASSPSP